MQCSQQCSQLCSFQSTHQHLSSAQLTTSHHTHITQPEGTAVARLTCAALLKHFSLDCTLLVACSALLPSSSAVRSLVLSFLLSCCAAMPAVAASIPLLIKNPHCPDYVFSTTVPSTYTVGDVKCHLSSTYRGHPAAGSQFLVCAGRLLSDSVRISELYASQPGGGDEGVTLHLAIRQQRTGAVSCTSPSQQSARQPPNAPATSESATSTAQSASPSESDASLSSSGAVVAPFVSPPAGYGVWPYASPAAHQLQLAWQWQQMAAAAQLGGLRQRQTSAPSARSSVASSPTAVGGGGVSSSTASLLPSLVAGSCAVPSFHAAAAAAALRTLPSPFFISPFATLATSPLAPHTALAPSALPSFASSVHSDSPSSTASTATSLSPAVSAPTAVTSSLPISSSSSQSVTSASAGAVRPSPVSSYVAAMRRYIDLRLLLKLGVLLLVFSRQGDSTRSVLLMGAAVLAYLWQVGLLRRRGRELNQADNAGGAANDGVEAGAAERDAVAHARREAREERRAGGAGGAGGGGGLGGLLAGMAGEAEDDDEEEDINLQREQLHIIQQQHQAELIRRGQRQVGLTEDGHGGVQLDTWVSATEKLVVGLFASLVPSWRPTIEAQ